MRVYNGWIISIEGKKFRVDGSIKIRSNQIYLLRGEDGEKSSISRAMFLKMWSEDKIKYVASAVPK
jgi:hypothetical protein